jgi:hypothetical protein
MRTKGILASIGFSCIAVIMVSTMGVAASDGIGSQGALRASMQACKGKAAGDQVGIVLEGAKLRAVCMVVRGQMVAVPEENLRACEGKAAGDRVELVRGGATIKAACRETNGRLVAIREGILPR